ncbi:hypothetical protein C8R47DRAFT_1217929 [Mycena vitilis]|nr:hypothetical protein C8R47DRAFT_1217929 [Mycena vitilis]
MLSSTHPHDFVLDDMSVDGQTDLRKYTLTRTYQLYMAIEDRKERAVPLNNDSYLFKDWEYSAIDIPVAGNPLDALPSQTSKLERPALSPTRPSMQRTASISHIPFLSQTAADELPGSERFSSVHRFHHLLLLLLLLLLLIIIPFSPLVGIQHQLLEVDRVRLRLVLECHAETAPPRYPARLRLCC